MPKPLNLYTVFHLNLAFSCIPKSHYPVIIRKCYKPLLDLAEKDGIPVGIELSGETLETIGSLAPDWVRRLKGLWRKGRVEVLGSGHVQAIMPLIPAEVNMHNLRFGNETYRRILGRRPKTAYVNEQTFSAGLVPLYLRTGYKAVMMDWSNPNKHHRFPPELLYRPQTALGPEGERIALIWNESIAFQKFQRFGHGDLRSKDYLAFLVDHWNRARGGALPLYGNDAEVFDYRPSENSWARSNTTEEWDRIREFLDRLRGDPRFAFRLPSEVLSLKKTGAFKEVELCSPETPIPAKKQEKYNITRWALAGRGNAIINAQCYAQFGALSRLEGRVGSPRRKERLRLWKDLCLAWGSDFRTTTTDEKNFDFHEHLGRLSTQLKGMPEQRGKSSWPRRGFRRPRFRILKSSATVETPHVKIRFNPHKGGTIESAVFPGISKRPLFGTIPHGFFRDIAYSVDFFSGHMVLFTKDGRKITDLGAVEMAFDEADGPSGPHVRARSYLQTPGLDVEKEYRVHADSPRVDLTYSFRCRDLPLSSLRLAHLSVLPGGFRKRGLIYSTVNGGLSREDFPLRGRSVRHTDPASPLVSAKHCLGATEGWVSIGDREKGVAIVTDKRRLAAAPMIEYSEFPDGEFARILHSLCEMDETSRYIWRGHYQVAFSFIAYREPRGLPRNFARDLNRGRTAG